MSDIAVFDHPEFGSVRHVLIDGDPWFVLADVAKILGYQRTSDAKKHLRDSQSTTADRRTGSELGFLGNMPTLITESGLYRLMLRSQAAHCPGAGGHPGGTPRPGSDVLAGQHQHRYYRCWTSRRPLHQTGMEGPSLCTTTPGAQECAI